MSFCSKLDVFRCATNFQVYHMMPACWSLLCYLLGFTIVICVAFETRVVKDGVKDYCQWEKFNASCTDEQVILMQLARYGRMSLGRCITSDYSLTCSSDVLQAVDRRCSGRHRCLIDIPDASLHQMTSCATDLMGYLEASYICVPVIVPRDVSCSKTLQVTQASGYLASVITAAYNYGSRKCPWRLSVEPGQKINITLLDFSLKQPSENTLTSGTGHEIGYCNVYAIVFESNHERETAICGGTKRTQVVYTSDTNTVEVKIVGHASEERTINFILKFEPIGCPDPVAPPEAWYTRDGDTAAIKCNFTSQTWHLVCKGNSWFGDVHNCTEEFAWNSQRRAKMGLWPPYGLLAAVVIGVILGVFLGLCLLGLVLVCKRRRDSRRRRAGGARPGPATVGTGHTTLCATYDPNDGREEAKIIRSCPDSGYSHVWELRSKEIGETTQEPSLTKLAPYHDRAQQIKSATLGRNHDHIYESPKFERGVCLRRSADHAHTLPFYHEFDVDAKGKRVRRVVPRHRDTVHGEVPHSDDTEDELEKVDLRFSKGMGYRPVPSVTCVEPTDPRRGYKHNFHAHLQAK